MASPRKRRSAKGVVFRDGGFRLAVIDALWNLGHFKAELAAAREAGGEPDDVGHDAAIEAELAKLVITPAQLAMIEKLAPDGGDEIYEVLGGGGDCRGYDVTSLEDVALLPNLTTIKLLAMCQLDLELKPLLGAGKLAEVKLDLGAKTKQSPVLKTLAKRGVKVS